MTPRPRAKILVTGGTGQVGRPIAEALARDHEVWCVARFSGSVSDRVTTTKGSHSAADGLQLRADLEKLGLATFGWDMRSGSLAGLPKDFTYVVHTAVQRSGEADSSIEANCRALGMLMAHCSDAQAFLHVSAAGVYLPMEPDHTHKETDPIGGVSAPLLPAYPAGKIAAEGAARALAHAFSLPTTIARLNVSYGLNGHGGQPVRRYREMLNGQPIPVPKGRRNYCNPIHIDDIIRQVPLLWDVASVPATVVNWGGDEIVSDQEFLTYISQLTGVPVVFEPSDSADQMIAYDNTRRRELIGECRVPWRDGMAAVIEAHFPGSIRQA